MIHIASHVTVHPIKNAVSRLAEVIEDLIAPHCGRVGV